VNARENLVVIGTGMIGSGKSRLLAERYVRFQPRVIHIDDNDEIRERVPGAVRTLGAGRLFDALALATRKGVRRFNIAAVGLETSDVCSLLDELAPRAGTKPSLALAFGSLAVECGEMGALCVADANVGKALGVAIMRSRHNGLSLFLATQYPYALPPTTRTNCHEVFFFQQDESQALVWCGQVIGAQGAARVAALRDHAFILYERLTGLLYECDKLRRVLRVTRKDGAPIDAPPADDRAQLAP
jgi:hypothetical protein